MTASARFAQPKQDLAELQDDSPRAVVKRRMDVLELREVCVALGTTLAKFARELERRMGG